MLKLATGRVVTHTFLSLTTKMVNVVLTDGEEDLRRPKCIPKPLATLLDDPNQATLPSHQPAIENFCIMEVALCTAETKLAIEAEAAWKATLMPDPSCGSSPVVSLGPVPSSSTSQHKNKRAYVLEEGSGNEHEESGDEREDAHTNPKPPGTFLSFGSN